jgi:putative peptidoglycan lipid II flippase
MLRKIINGKIDSITIAAFLVGFSSLASRMLGIFRDRILAGEFGAGDALDVYYASFRIPDLIFNLLVLGALSAGFIPIFCSILKSPIEKIKDTISDDHKKAWLFTSQVLNLIFISIAILSSLGIIFAPQIMRLITPGFNPEKISLAASLSRIMFLSPIFLGLSSVIGGVLQSFKRFFIYSLSPIFYNIGIIIGALFLVPKFGIYGLAWGVVLGAVMHMAIQIPSLFQLGYKFSFKLGIKAKDIKELAIMMVPRTLSLGIQQINLVVITGFASTLSSGSLSIFNLANNLQSFPVGIFGLSFAVAAFPVFSSAAFNKSKLIASISQTTRQILFFIIPSTVLFLSLRAQVVRIILGTGNFSWQNTLLTVDTLFYFSLSLFAQSLLPLLVRVFYARHDSSRPFYIGLVSALINIALAFLLSRSMGVAGLALAFSISTIVNLILILAILRIELGSLDEYRVLLSTLKFIFAGIMSALGIQGMKLLVWPYIDMTKFFGIFIQGASAAIFGILIYLAVCALLQSEEIFAFWDSFRRRLNWKKVDTTDQGEARGI